jgi:hypothetical protein
MPEPVSELTKSNESSLRWWEFYVVRYAMGTVVGGIVFYLLCRATPHLNLLLFETIPVAGQVSNTQSLPSLQLDAARLTLLAAYGLVFCYVSSAPILVFHAGRFLLTLNVARNVWLNRSLLCLAPPIIVAIFAWWRGGTLSVGTRWFATIGRCAIVS